jgi:hypothetical protein
LISLNSPALVGSQEPRFRTCPDGAVSSWGPQAIGLAESISLDLDLGQKDLLQDGMSLKRDGLWLASEVNDTEPRQNGKTLALEVRALAGAYLIKEPLIVWTAHEFKTAKQSFESLRDKITNWDHLRKRVKSIRQSGATTEIELFNPMRKIVFLARSGNSGRGFAQVAPLFLDESQELTEEQMAALVFAMSAAKNPQVWYMGSAPLKDSEVLRELCKRGRRGSRTMIYYEWSSAGTEKDLIKLVRDNKMLPEHEIDTPRGQELRSKLFERVAQANRAFRVRISDDTIERELGATGPEQFARERLGAWSELEAGGKIDPERWEELGDPESRREGDVALALDISIERDWSAIGMYGKRADGIGHLQLIDYRPGTDWVINALIAFREALDPIAVGMGRGTYASLKTQLADAGFIRPEDRPPTDPRYRLEGAQAHQPERGDLAILNGSDMAAACGQLLDAVRQGTMRHVPADQLTGAVRVAQTRVVGDTMTWVRTEQGTDITGLVSVTEARWTFESRINQLVDYDPANDLF